MEFVTKEYIEALYNRKNATLTARASNCFGAYRWRYVDSPDFKESVSINSSDQQRADAQKDQA